MLRVGLLGALSGAEFFLALRGRAGQDCDLPVPLGHRAGSQRQTQHRGQRQAKQFLHNVYPPSIFSIPGALSTQSAKQRKRFVTFKNVFLWCNHFYYSRLCHCTQDLFSISLHISLQFQGQFRRFYLVFRIFKFELCIFCVLSAFRRPNRLTFCMNVQDFLFRRI